MNFKPLTLQEIGIVRPYFEIVRSRTCDFSVGGMFMWRDFFQMEYAVTEHTFYSRLRGSDGKVYYNLPLAADMETAVGRLLCAEQGETPIRFCTIPAAYIPLFEKQGRNISVSEQTEFFDYLYNAEDLVGLKGKKYSGQRNQISQFKRNVGTWSFNRLDETCLGRVIDFFRGTYLETSSDGAYEREENRKVLEVLEHFDAYGMVGGCLTADGAVVGFSLNEIIGDTLFTHIEKADRGCKGAYQMIVNQNAAAFADERIRFINREEDMGDPGLRTSKQSYHPVELLKKYIVEVK